MGGSGDINRAWEKLEYAGEFTYRVFHIYIYINGTATCFGHHNTVHYTKIIHSYNITPLLVKYKCGQRCRLNMYRTE
jgi:hypothetical protein